MNYQHSYLHGERIDLPIGKVVCIARNYVDHIRELDNPMPEEPILFIKPATSLVPLQQSIRIPAHRGACHHEVELAVLIGTQLTHASVQAAQQAIIGYGIALDLTLREVQNKLKQQGHPWEIAKAFDAACPISPFLKPEEVAEPQALELSLEINAQLRQQGNTRCMINGIFALLSYISQHFTLQPGDIVLTGTPAGVGALNPGDRLVLKLGSVSFTTQVA